MKEYIFYTILSLALIKSNVLAQSGGTKLPDVILPSPKASSIMKFGEYPVSLYTGLVDISVPIYTIDIKGIKVPIEFKYHASGIKYDDVSNEVGLGWTLMAGGVIRRSIMGNWDDEGETYSRDITKIKVCDSDPSPFDNDYIKLREVENGSRGRNSYDNSIRKKDGEFDIYSFSFLNHSGSFCFPFLNSEVDGTVRPSGGLFIPANGMKVIDNSMPNLRFGLLDTDGVYYMFEVKDVDNNEKYKEYYLTKIISADKADTINFTYEVVSTFSYCIKRPYINYTATVATTQGISSDAPYPVSNTTESGGLYYQELRPPRLKRIDFRGGHLDFEYSVINGITTWDLQKIRIYNMLEPSSLQTISLTKSSFANSEKRLDKVTFSNTEGQSYDYQFGYNGEPGNIFSSGTAKGIDYWGYFNGQNVPYGKRFIPRFPNMPYGIEGADRNVVEHIMQGGSLNKIIYPTKGYSLFIYEAHKARYSLGTEVQIFGGLRIAEIKNYNQDGTLAEKKWYKYGENESGTGMANTYPDINDFLVQSRTLITHAGGGYSQHLCQMINSTTYSTFPKISYFISGSPVVYPEVTEYTGNNTEDYGKTVYRYKVVLDEKIPQYGDTYRWNTPNAYLRTNTWKTGKLLSKTIFKKEESSYKEISRTINDYQDINTAEFRNVRVLPYMEFTTNFDAWSGNVPEVKRDFCNYSQYRQYFGGNNPTSLTPYDYFNFYTTTGLQVLSSTEEKKDGVTTITNYDSYNENGLPLKISTTSSSEGNLITIFKYPTDFSTTVYNGMKSANIVTPVIEKATYAGNRFLEKEIFNYKLWYSRFYAPENSQVQYENGQTDARLKFEYDINGNYIEITKDNTDIIAYLWSYNGLYPIAEIKNASYATVAGLLGQSLIDRINKETAVNMPYVQEALSCLRTNNTTLKDAFVSTYLYRPLIGMTEEFSLPSSIRTFYTYDSFGRLKESYIYDDKSIKQILQSYDYHYINQ